MKKGLILVTCLSSLMLLSTGCVNTKNLSKEVYIQGTNREYIAYELEDWRNLLDEIDVLNTYSSGNNIWVRDDTYDQLTDSTYTGQDNSYIKIQHIDSEQGKKAVEYAARHLGDALYAVIEETRNLEGNEVIVDHWRDEQVQMLTRTVNDYSIIGVKGNERIDLYIMHEPFNLRHEEDEAFVNQFKTDGFLLKAFSQGADASIIEIATPSYMIRTYGADLYNSTSYYQFFRDSQRALTKTRMVINAYEQNPIYKEEFAPLQKVIAYLGGEEGLGEEIQEEVNQIIKGNSQGKVIKSGELKCTIKKHNGLAYQEKLIEIVVE